MDGTQTVTITASATGFADATDTLEVTDGDGCFTGLYTVGPVTYTGLELHQSTTLLETSGPVLVTDGAIVTFEAVDGVMLNPLFEVELGGLFDDNAGPYGCSGW